MRSAVGKAARHYSYGYSIMTAGHEGGRPPRNASNVPAGGDHPGAESAAEQPRKRGIPLLKCKFVAESLAKVRLIGDSLSTVARLSIEFEH
jgi:hypothetical protein